MSSLSAASEIVLVLEYVSISLLEFLVRKSSSTCLFCFLLFRGKGDELRLIVCQREICRPNSDQTVSAQQKLEAMPVVPFFGPFLTIRHVDKQLVGSQDPKFDL